MREEYFIGIKERDFIRKMRKCIYFWEKGGLLEFEKLNLFIVLRYLYFVIIVLREGNKENMIY